MDQPKGIIVKYTADKMRAFVSLSQNFGQVTPGMVLTELLHKGVVHGLNTAVIHKLVNASIYDKFVEAAQGTPVVPGADGRIELLVEGVSGESGVVLSKRKPVCEFVVVKSGAQLARRVPPVKGVDGMDIFGNAIVAPRVKDAYLRGGSGTVCRPGAPDILLAEHDGVFELAPNGEVIVHPYMEIDGDVGAAGKVSFKGCLKVAGAVRSSSSVEATGSLMVEGDIEGALVRCGGDLSLRSEVRGSGMAVIECGGSVQAGAIEDAKLSAGGGVTVDRDIVGSEVAAGGLVKARRIVGGSVAAVGGISALQAGVEDGPPTVLDVAVVHAYMRKRDGLRGSIETQNVLSEGYMSELYCFVRDSMGESGEIPEGKIPGFTQFLKNLTDSIAACREFEKNLGDVEALLRGATGCSISVHEVYPNVTIRVGFSEQRVTTILKNVLLKPAGVHFK
jgi:uncharacterized protein (DUF342 family)